MPSVTTPSNQQPHDLDTSLTSDAQIGMLREEIVGGNVAPFNEWLDSLCENGRMRYPTEQVSRLFGCPMPDQMFVAGTEERNENLTTAVPYTLEWSTALKLPTGSALLDVGAGIGLTAALLSLRLPHSEVTAVELLSECVREARAIQERLALKNLHIIEGDALSLDTSRFTHFYMYLPFDDITLARFLAKVVRECPAGSARTIISRAQNEDIFDRFGFILDQEVPMRHAIEVFRYEK